MYLSPSTEFKSSEDKLQFKNGSEILFRHLQEPNKLKSLNLGFIEIEEMSDTPESTFLMLLSRLRQKNEWGKEFQYRFRLHRMGWQARYYLRLLYQQAHRPLHASWRFPNSDWCR